MDEEKITQRKENVRILKTKLGQSIRKETEKVWQTKGN